MGKYVWVRQHDITDCGAACLAIIAKQHKLKVSLAKIRQIAGTDKNGTTALGMIKAAIKIGFNAKAIRAEKKHLTQAIPLPCVAHVIKNDLHHYVVIHHINKDRMIIADPDIGIMKYSSEQFCEIWTGVLIFMVPADHFQPGDETTGILTQLISLLMPYKGLLMQIFAASVLYSLFGIAGAFYMKLLIDEIVITSVMQTLHIITIGALIAALCRILLDAFRNHLLVYLGQKIDIVLILNYYQHVLELPLNFFDSRRVGEIISRLADATKIRTAISSAAVTMMLDTLMVGAAGLILYLQNRTLFFVTIIFVPFYVLVFGLFNKPYEKIQRKSMEFAAEFESYLVESLNGAALIKAFCAEKDAQFETESKFIRLVKTTFKDLCLRNIQRSLQMGLSIIGELIILWVGGWQIIQGNLSIGQLVTYNALLVYFYQPIANLAGLQPHLKQACIAVERLREIFDLSSEKQVHSGTGNIYELAGAVEFINVDFRYGTRQLALKSVNLQIRPGDKVAFVGESGSGKSTVAKLVLGFYQVESGRIRLDDYCLADLDLNVLRTRIGYVPQEVFLFSGTIWQNITFGLHNICFEDVAALTRRSKAFSFIEQLPHRFNTMVGERGIALSGGQRQQIAIMRALLKQPDILIMDEGTSSLDVVTEKAVYQLIDEVYKDRTMITIAHRLSTASQCNQIFVFDNGELVESGSHKRLLKNCGKYYDMWCSQNCREIRV